MTISTKPARPSWWSLALTIVVVAGASQALHWWQAQSAARTVQQLAKAGDVTLYTTSTCHYCAKARQWLENHQIPWRECNIEQDRTCQQAFAAQGAPGVPLMNVKGQWHLGFDAVWLGQALQAEAKVTANRPVRP